MQKKLRSIFISYQFILIAMQISFYLLSVMLFTRIFSDGNIGQLTICLSFIMLSSSIDLGTAQFISRLSIKDTTTSKTTISWCVAIDCLKSFFIYLLFISPNINQLSFGFEKNIFIAIVFSFTGTFHFLKRMYDLQRRYIVQFLMHISASASPILSIIISQDSSQAIEYTLLFRPIIVLFFLIYSLFIHFSVYTRKNDVIKTENISLIRSIRDLSTLSLLGITLTTLERQTAISLLDSKYTAIFLFYLDMSVRLRMFGTIFFNSLLRTSFFKKEDPIRYSFLTIKNLLRNHLFFYIFFLLTGCVIFMLSLPIATSIFLPKSPKIYLIDEVIYLFVCLTYPVAAFLFQTSIILGKSSIYINIYILFNIIYFSMPFWFKETGVGIFLIIILLRNICETVTPLLPLKIVRR